MSFKLTRQDFLKGAAAVLASSAGLAAPSIWRSGRASAQTPVTLKLAHPDTNLHPVQGIATQFSEMVAKKTDGAVKIQVFSGGQLGSEVNIVSGMQTGIVDMAFHTTGFLENFFPRIQVLDLPFLFKDAQTAERLLDGPIGQQLLGDMLGKGVYGFVWGHYGWRETETASQPIHEPTDLRGLKIRIQPGAVFAASFKAVGAIPVVMDLSEVYIGISQKTVNGLELPFMAVVSSKLYEVTKFTGLTNHVYNAGALMASKIKFDKLDPAHQKAIREAATEIQPIWRTTVAQKTEEGRKFCESKGMTISETNYTAFRTAMAPVYDEFRDKIGADLVQQVMKATAA
ncbi:MAG TPA: TRAP transporter substrate-binding protein [Xanthobacteraceae bacterium]|jgi:tripartite ATP-independent transporter DctP family solute receptor|nr:TRAP transporter substrate-binding protein [Xanthobacteraceae bacterium]